MLFIRFTQHTFGFSFFYNDCELILKGLPLLIITCSEKVNANDEQYFEKIILYRIFHTKTLVIIKHTNIFPSNDIFDII